MRDSEIVASIAAGDPAGLAWAYDRYAQALFAYCQTLLAEPADAADAVHDAFVIATAHAGALRNRDRFRLWLRTVAAAVSRHKVRVDGAAQPENWARRQPPTDLPPGLRDRVLATATGTGPVAVAYRDALESRRPSFGQNGFPKGWFWDSRYGDATVISGAAAMAGVAGAVIVLAVLTSGGPHRTLADGLPGTRVTAGGTPAAPSSPGGQPGSPGAPGSGGRGGAGPGRVSSPPGGPGSTPAGGVPGGPSPTTTVPGGPPPSPSSSPGAPTPPGPTPTTVPPTGVPPTSAPPPTPAPPPSPTPTTRTPAPTPTPVRSTPPPPPPAAGSLSVSPGTIAVSPLLGNTLTLTASGGPVTWSVSEPSSLLGSLIVSPSSGTLAAGQSAQVTITVNGLASLDTTLTVNPGGEQVTVVVGAL